MGLGGSKTTTKQQQSQQGSNLISYIGENGDSGSPLGTLAGNYAGMAGQSWDLRNQLLGGTDYANAMRAAWMRAYPGLFGSAGTTPPSAPPSAPPAGGGGSRPTTSTSSARPGSVAYSVAPGDGGTDGGTGGGGSGGGNDQGQGGGTPPGGGGGGGGPVTVIRPDGSVGHSVDPKYRPWTDPKTTPVSSGEGDPGGPIIPPNGMADASGGLMGQYAALLGSRGYDPTTRAAMQQQAMEGARGASDSAMLDLTRHAAASGNTAGYYGGRSQVAQGQQQALSKAAQDATISNYAEAQRQQELGRQGYAGLLGLTDQDLNSFLQGAGNILGQKRGVSTTMDASGSGESKESNWGLNIGSILGLLA